MQIFYAPDITGDLYVLDENESKHIVRVLRMRKGMQVKLIDGKGNLYEGIIYEDNPKRCVLKITGGIKEYEKRNYRLHIAISPLKNTDRFEWFIEKSVEIGIDSIYPVICHNTEKSTIKAERLNSIIISAMKQSLKASLTMLQPAQSFTDFLQQPQSGIKMIAHCSEAFSRRKIDEIYVKGNDAVILIGPEGDFTPGEIELAVKQGFHGVHLGKSRLRSETAGIAACHSVYFLNQ